MIYQVEAQHKAHFKSGGWYEIQDGKLIAFSQLKKFKAQQEEDKAIKKEIYQQLELEDSDDNDYDVIERMI